MRPNPRIDLKRHEELMLHSNVEYFWRGYEYGQRVAKYKAYAPDPADLEAVSYYKAGERHTLTMHDGRTAL